MHAIVGNQVAEGDSIPVAQRLRQLMAQGLTRHQAIHAIASVLMNHVVDIMQSRVGGEKVNERYYAAFRRLNARKRLRSG
jgi:hypothetical protein